MSTVKLSTLHQVWMDFPYSGTNLEDVSGPPLKEAYWEFDSGGLSLENIQPNPEGGGGFGLGSTLPDPEEGGGGGFSLGSTLPDPEEVGGGGGFSLGSTLPDPDESGGGGLTLGNTLPDPEEDSGGLTLGNTLS